MKFMETKIQKWGNSLAIRLPKAFANQIRIENGSEVNIQIDDGKIIVIPLKRNEIILEEFLSKIDETNIHDEINFGKAVGRELL
jgi:antitoxin MazE